MPAKPRQNPTPERTVQNKLDQIVRLLEDLFIVEAIRAGMNVGAVRQHLGVRKTRVSNIAKHLE